ncbi:MAG TPA: hypothetical protein VFY59_18095 [Rubrobacter sp.]|nr:hypothetical protein [Rubrobacter sp.]
MMIEEPEKSSRWRKIALLLAMTVLCAVAVVLAAVPPAEATLPGINGKIAFANGGIWAMRQGAEEPTRLTSNVMDRDPSWSPDGTRIAFTRLNGCQDPSCVFGDVWVMDADGTNQRRVTEGFNPSWSPNGRKLAYESCAASGFYPCDNDKRDVSLISPDGTNRVDLTERMSSPCNSNTPSMEVQPAWSADGRKITFVSTAESCRFEVYVMNTDGTARIRLSRAGMNQADANPSWSPDGNEIVFSRSYEAEMPRVFSVDPDGVLGEVAYPGAQGFEPAWSPDGRAIVHRATPGNALTLVDVTGKSTPLGTIGATPDWQTLPNTRPVITRPRPAPGTEIRDATPTVGAVVTDREKNLTKSGIKLVLDGRARTFTYEAGTGKISYTSGKLAFGSHTVRVVATDRQGLTATRSWSFKVIR